MTRVVRHRGEIQFEGHRKYVMCSLVTKRKSSKICLRAQKAAPYVRCRHLKSLRISATETKREQKLTRANTTTNGQGLQALDS